MQSILKCYRWRLPSRPLSPIVCVEAVVVSIALSSISEPVLLGPHGPGEVRCIERWLATARLALVTSALFPVWMEPNQISWCAQWLLSIEIVHGTVAMLLLRFHQAVHYDVTISRSCCGLAVARLDLRIRHWDLKSALSFLCIRPGCHRLPMGVYGRR